MEKIRPNLSVNIALEAIELYKEIFNAELQSRIPVEKEQAAGFGIPEDSDFSKMTIHSGISLSDEIIYLSDNFTGDVLK